jgi:hypothetical protein
VYPAVSGGTHNAFPPCCIQLPDMNVFGLKKEKQR